MTGSQCKLTGMGKAVIVDGQVGHDSTQDLLLQPIGATRIEAPAETFGWRSARIGFGETSSQ